MSDVMLRPVEVAEFSTYIRSIHEAFGADAHEADVEADRTVFEPDRSLGGFDGDRLVSTAGIFSRRLTVPGAEIPIAGVTMVSVAPTHRRRGILTAMMRRQLTELHEQAAEPVAALWASESLIYGRFGYGMATRQASVRGKTRELTVTAETGDGIVRRAEQKEARPHLAAVYDAARTGEVGWLDRAGLWWDYVLHDPEHSRHGSTSLRYALYERAGEVTGYAVYRTKQVWGDGENGAEVRVHDLAALDPPSYAGLWRYLLSLDLMRRFTKRHAPADEPLQLAVDNPRGVELSVSDGLWVRLVDVDRALAARRYARDLDVVFEVSDRFCPWNAGRWRLSAGPAGATCAPTQDPADLAASAADLGAAYLGGTSLAALAAAGRVRELRPGALATAAEAFGTERTPWCPEIF